MDPVFLKKLSEIVDQNLADPDFGSERLCELIGMSHSSLLRKLRTQAGLSINQYIRRARLEKAKEILTREDVSAAEVAFRTGFNSPTYFNSCFSEHFGYPPGEVKKHAKEGEAETFKHRVSHILRDGRRYFVLASVLILLMIIGFKVVQAVFQKPSIAVVPFDLVVDNSQNRLFAGSFENQLSTELDKLDGLEVKSRAGAGPKELMTGSPIRIGKELKVNYLVMGTASRIGNRFNLWISLVEAKRGVKIWSGSYERVASTGFQVEKEVAPEVAARIGMLLKGTTGGSGQSVEPGTSEAWISIKKGQFHLSRIEIAPELAVHYYRKAIAQDSTLPDAWLGFMRVNAYLYSVPGLGDDSLLTNWDRANQKLKAIDAENPGIRREQAYFDLQTGNFVSAAEKGLETVRISPDNDQAVIALASAYQRLGNFIRAGEVLKEGLKYKPKSPGILGALGLNYEFTKDYTNAEFYFRSALSRDPLRSDCITGLVNVVLKRDGDVHSARLRLDSLVSQAGGFEMDTTRIKYQVSVLDMLEGNYSKALATLDSWTCEIPLSPPDYMRPRNLLKAMAYGYLRDKDLERKYYDSTRMHIEKLRMGSKRNQVDPRLMSGLAMAMAGRGNYPDALRMAEETIQLLEQSGDRYLKPFILEDIAWIYAKAGMGARSVAMLKDLLEQPGPLTTEILRMDPRWLVLSENQEFKKIIKSY
jgi:AraC-like DNA-binding protein/TolB-like protein/tetratricopeptide (TPR) repeat protein